MRMMYFIMMVVSVLVSMLVCSVLHINDIVEKMVILMTFFMYVIINILSDIYEEVKNGRRGKSKDES